MGRCSDVVNTFQIWNSFQNQLCTRIAKNQTANVKNCNNCTLNSRPNFYFAGNIEYAAGAAVQLLQDKCVLQSSFWCKKLKIYFYILFLLQLKLLCVLPRQNRNNKGGCCLVLWFVAASNSRPAFTAALLYKAKLAAGRCGPKKG